MGQRQSKFRPLAPGEKAIGFRLNYIRKCGNISLSQLSSQAGLTYAQLANIESGRVPLKAAAAWTICRELNVFPSWLAFGHTEDVFPAMTEAELKWFDRVLERYRKMTFSSWWGQLAFLIQEDQTLNFEQMVSLGQIPELKTDTDHNQNEVKLDKARGILNNPDVKRIRSLPELLKWLRKLTNSRGSKVALAKEMHVTRQAVDQWLSGTSKPTAEMAFALLNWVEQHRLKK